MTVTNLPFISHFFLFFQEKKNLVNSAMFELPTCNALNLEQPKSGSQKKFEF